MEADPREGLRAGLWRGLEGTRIPSNSSAIWKEFL
jgi:hypothetical protein